MVGTMRGRLVALLLSSLVLVGTAGAVAQAQRASASTEQRALVPAARQGLLEQYLEVGQGRATIFVGAQLRANQAQLAIASHVFDRQGGKHAFRLLAAAE